MQVEIIASKSTQLDFVDLIPRGTAPVAPVF